MKQRSHLNVNVCYLHIIHTYKTCKYLHFDMLFIRVRVLQRKIQMSKSKLSIISQYQHDVSYRDNMVKALPAFLKHDVCFSRL